MGSECFSSINTEYDEELEKYIQKIKEQNYSNKSTIRKRYLSTDEFDRKYSTYFSIKNKNHLFNETYSFEQRVNIDSLNAIIPKRSKSFTQLINNIYNV